MTGAWDQIPRIVTITSTTNAVNQALRQHDFDKRPATFARTLMLKTGRASLAFLPEVRQELSV